MKIRIVFWIAAVSTFLQALPLYLSMFSKEFKLILIGDFFGGSPSTDAVVMFDQFALVVGLLALGFSFICIGATKLKGLVELRRISFLLFVFSGFFALPDLISVSQGNPTAPLPVIILGLTNMVLLYYGYKKGVI
jgi:hypothetical protein|tara:strand:+ start:3803 stop:4207 length:405 start_codon:yes stop_codon:yes gene_type:complete